MSDTHLRFSRCAEEIFKCVLSLLCGIKRQQAHESHLWTEMRRGSRECLVRTCSWWAHPSAPTYWTSWLTDIIPTRDGWMVCFESLKLSNITADMLRWVYFTARSQLWRADQAQTPSVRRYRSSFPIFYSLYHLFLVYFCVFQALRSS